jgi:hypothetical protein
MKMESPHQTLNELWRKIPQHIKVTFASAIVFGFFVHMQFMANMLVNNDSAYFLYEMGKGQLPLGRWFSFVLEWLRGLNYSLTWINSALALIHYALASCLIVSCLSINKNVYCILLSWLVVSHPTAVSNFTYAAYLFSLAFLFSCLAAFVMVKAKHSACYAWVFVVLVLSTYQGYISVTIGLLLSALAIGILRQRFSGAKQFFITGAMYLLSIAVGFGANTLFLNLILRAENTQLDSYMGINEFGGLTFANLGQRLYDAYAYGFQYYYKDTFSVHSSVYLGFINFKILIVVMGILAALIVGAVVLTEKLYKNVVLLAFLALMLFLIPLGCHIVSVMAPSDMHLNMMYGLIIPLFFMLALLDISAETFLLRLKGVWQRFASVACWLMLAIVSLYAVNYSELASQAYMRLELVNKQATAYATILFARIQSEDFYTPERTIVLAGHAPITSSIASLSETDSFAGVTQVLGPGMWSYPQYLSYHLGIEQEIRYLNRNYPLSQRELDALLEMPLYPAHGSIRLVGEEIFVRIAEWDYIIDKFD